MLHSSSFKKIVKKNKNYKDIGFKFTTVAVFIRRVLDLLGLYSVADAENGMVRAIKDDEEFEIVVDRANQRLVLEADLWNIGTRAFIKKKAQTLERLNRYNQNLNFGCCMLVGCKVIYRTTESIYMGVDDAEDLSVADRLIRYYMIDTELIKDMVFSDGLDCVVM